MHEAQPDGARRTSFSLMERAVAADNKSPPIGDDTSTHGASLHGENAARRQVGLLGCTVFCHAPHVTCCCYCSHAPLICFWVLIGMWIASCCCLQAITELLFFASVGDVSRCKKICKTWRIQVCTRTAEYACTVAAGRSASNSRLQRY